MNAKREGDNVVLTLSAQEAHVLIWGGPSDMYGRLQDVMRTTLVGVEDADFTNDEYQALFGDLESVYAALREQIAGQRS